MKYIIGLTGSHGTGKSTIIQGVKNLGLKVDESQLSRAAQKALGWSDLSPAQESEEQMWALQEAILGAMYDRDQRINESKQITLVDRTPADVWGYTMLWLMRLDAIGRANREHEFDFRKRCRVMASEYACHLVVPIKEEIPFVAESNRADFDSREFHERQVKAFVIPHLEHQVIESISVEDRISEVVKEMEYQKTFGSRFER